AEEGSAEEGAAEIDFTKAKDLISTIIKDNPNGSAITPIDLPTALKKSERMARAVSQTFPGKQGGSLTISTNDFAVYTWEFVDLKGGVDLSSIEMEDITTDVIQNGTNILALSTIKNEKGEDITALQTQYDSNGFSEVKIDNSLDTKITKGTFSLGVDEDSGETIEVYNTTTEYGLTSQSVVMIDMRKVIQADDETTVAYTYNGKLCHSDYHAVDQAETAACAQVSTIGEIIFDVSDLTTPLAGEPGSIAIVDSLHSEAFEYSAGAYDGQLVISIDSENDGVYDATNTFTW
ncbi:MAG: hypothetical protein D6B27_02690, partial [Gammaproteobacteria bacterium]